MSRVRETDDRQLINSPTNTCGSLTHSRLRMFTWRLSVVLLPSPLVPKICFSVRLFPHLSTRLSPHEVLPLVAEGRFSQFSFLSCSCTLPFRFAILVPPSPSLLFVSKLIVVYVLHGAVLCICDHHFLWAFSFSTLFYVCSLFFFSSCLHPQHVFLLKVLKFYAIYEDIKD